MAQTIKEFNAYIDRYIKDHKCYGETSVDGPSHPRPFVPRTALKEFWTRNKIIDALNEQGQTVADIESIQTDYLALFSILVSLTVPKPKEIGKFMEIRLGDSRLPLTTRPEEWRDVPDDDLTILIDEFKKCQWKFCPLTLGSRLSKAQLDAYQIIPISNKKLIDNHADEEEDDVLVYEAQWHSECWGPFRPPQKCTVVLKEYREFGQNSDAVQSFDNEIDVYSSFNDKAFDHIIRYFGSYKQQGKSTAILEYASEGNLLEFFEKNPGPSNHQDRVDFWDSFFDLLIGLEATHNLNEEDSDSNSRGQWLLKGIHQDIRPQNILITHRSPDAPYRLTMKLTDFGTGHVRRCRAHGLDPMAAQRVGNGMYSAPDAYRDDRIPRPQLCECDVWSLGAVASEAFVWSLRGNDSRRQYQRRRSEATGRTDLSGGYHEGAFHDGTCRLLIVEFEHRDALWSAQRDDPVSPIVNKTILDYMLQANPKERRSAKETYKAWRTDILPAFQRDVTSPPGSRTWGIHSQTTSSRMQNTNGLWSQEQSTAPYHDSDSIPFSAEPSAMTPVGSSVSQMLPAYTRASGYNGSTNAARARMDQSFRHRQSASTADRDWRQSGHESSIWNQQTGINRSISTIDNYNRNWDAIDGSTAAGSRATSNFQHLSQYTPNVPRGHIDAAREYRSSMVETPSQMTEVGVSGLNYTSSLRGRPSTPGRRAPQTRESVDDHYDIEDSMIRDAPNATGLGLSDEEGHLRSPVSSMGVNRSPTYGTISAAHPQLPEQWVAGPSMESGPIITVDDIFTRCLKPSDKNTFMLRRMKSTDKNPLHMFPPLNNALDRLKSYEGREQVFIVDDSVSMERHKDQMGKTVRVLARLLKSGDVDPDKQQDLYYTCSPQSKFNHKHSTKLQDSIDAHVFSSGPCDMYSNLDDIVTQVLRGPKAVSMYILTNGRWNAKGADDTCNIEKIIERIVKSVHMNRKQGNHVGIQFIRFYQANNPLDEAGRKRLKFLDDALEGLEDFKKLGVGKSDIVDTTDWDGDVRKMLLGGVFSDSDDAQGSSYLIGTVI